MLLNDLKFFKLTEFRHPELVNPIAAEMLDEIRKQANFPLVLTDDARLPTDKPTGYAKDSLHYKGQAFDIRINNLSAVQLFDLIMAVINVSMWVARGSKAGVEMELVSSKSDKHLHVGFFLGDGRANRLIVSAE